MDSNLITAAAAMLGSLTGAAASILTTWIAQRSQSARSQIEDKLRRFETLYSEFITEAARLTVEALGHSVEQPETFVKLYGILGRIRLVAADPVLTAAAACVHEIVELYAKPNMTIEQIREALEGHRLDPIRHFSTVCRAELLEITSGF